MRKQSVKSGRCHQVDLIAAGSGSGLAAASAVDKVAKRFLRAHIIWPSLVLTMNGRGGMRLLAEQEPAMALSVVSSEADRRCTRPR